MKNDPEMTFIGASVEHGADLAAAERAAMERPKMDEALTAARGMRVGRTVAANFPPFETLPADNAFSLKRGEPLEVIAARPAGGRSLLVQDIAKLEQQLIAAG
ncbi:TPA: hypothetical protein QDZ36_004378, partial [Stenotrophomonas maltophilia]|nr:hypothetical protein [Stenotrophomonas maltophilia]